MQSTKNCSYDCTICVEWVHSTQPQLRTSEVQYSRLYTSLERLIELRPGGLSSIKSVLDLCTSLEYCTLLRSYNIGLCIISTWVDDSICSSKDPLALLTDFRMRANYTLKGVGEPRYYLGGDYGRVSSKLLPTESMATFYLSAKTYIMNVCEKIEALGFKLRNWQMPMCADYRPETDCSALLSKEMISKYRMLVGSGLWATTLGRYDVLYAVNTFARYNSTVQKWLRGDLLLSK